MKTVGACSTASVKPQHKGAICLQSSQSVILIPTMCGPHDVCETPIVADICERIERDISIKP